jgi:hypothetical protein
MNQEEEEEEVENCAQSAEDKDRFMGLTYKRRNAFKKRYSVEEIMLKKGIGSEELSTSVFPLEKHFSTENPSVSPSVSVNKVSTAFQPKDTVKVKRTGKDSHLFVRKNSGVIDGYNGSFWIVREDGRRPPPTRQAKRESDTNKEETSKELGSPEWISLIKSFEKAFYYTDSGSREQKWLYGIKKSGSRKSTVYQDMDAFLKTSVKFILICARTELCMEKEIARADKELQKQRPLPPLWESYKLSVPSQKSATHATDQTPLRKKEEVKHDDNEDPIARDIAVKRKTKVANSSLPRRSTMHVEDNRGVFDEVEITLGLFFFSTNMRGSFTLSKTGVGSPSFVTTNGYGSCISPFLNVDMLYEAYQKNRASCFEFSTRFADRLTAFVKFARRSYAFKRGYHATCAVCEAKQYETCVCSTRSASYTKDCPVNAEEIVRRDQSFGDISIERTEGDSKESGIFKKFFTSGHRKHRDHETRTIIGDYNMRSKMDFEAACLEKDEISLVFSLIYETTKRFVKQNDIKQYLNTLVTLTEPLRTSEPWSFPFPQGAATERKSNEYKNRTKRPIVLPPKPTVTDSLELRQSLTSSQTMIEKERSHRRTTPPDVFSGIIETTRPIEVPVDKRARSGSKRSKSRSRSRSRCDSKVFVKREKEQVPHVYSDVLKLCHFLIYGERESLLRVLNKLPEVPCDVRRHKRHGGGTKTTTDKHSFWYSKESREVLKTCDLRTIYVFHPLEVYKVMRLRFEEADRKRYFTDKLLTKAITMVVKYYVLLLN